MTVGVASGILSVVGYTLIQPKLQQLIGLHDTCGVNNLHGMPGILAAIVSAIVCAMSSRDQFPSLEHQIAVYGARKLGKDGERTAMTQAGCQILCLVVCLNIAVVSGMACAWVVKFVDSLRETDAFVDSSLWEVPELETPFFFDRRGEINRDMLITSTERGKPGLAIGIEEGNLMGSHDDGGTSGDKDYLLGS